MPSDPLPLRPHHLLCILTYSGKGYSEDFVRNFDSVIERIHTGNRRARIVIAPDIICKGYQNHPDCHCAEPRLRDRDLDALTGLHRFKAFETLKDGDEVDLSPEIIQNLRTQFKSGTVRLGCRNCEWFDFCTGIAATDFEGTKLT